MSKAKKVDDKKKQEIKEEKVEEFPELTAYGNFEFQNQIKYVGYYKQLTTGVKIRQGKGKLIHPYTSEFPEEYYEGDWKEDKMEGFGVYQYSNGDVYEGEWKDNLHQGYGKYLFTDGSRYEGEWKEHRMHGSGKYWDINNVNWAGEFRDGCYISKDQARLKEEKRILKKINKIKEAPMLFFKNWEETFVKVDKKNMKEILSPFFAKLESMGIYVKENYPKLEDKTADKWNEAFKFAFNMNNNANINVPKSANELIFLDKNSLLCPQLQEDLSSGQVVEVQTILDARKINLGLGYNRDMNRWLIVHFTEVIEKKK